MKDELTIDDRNDIKNMYQRGYTLRQIISRFPIIEVDLLNFLKKEVA